jgi:diguanylate cyclase (GGDEF)-like protein
LSASILIVESAAPVIATLRKAAESVSAEIRPVSKQEEALAALSSDPAMVIASANLVDAEVLVQKVKEASPKCPVVLVFTPDDSDPDAKTLKAGADACLIGPLKHGVVVSCVRAMMRIRDLQETVLKLEGDLKQRVSEPPLAGTRGTTTTEFEFFKKTLLMEIKRSRRYRYPVSFLLIGIDHFREKVASLEPPKQHSFLAEALSIVAQAVRDIDLAVPFSDGRFLAFLPHTPRNGAGVVATRLRERLATTSLPDVTVSVGVAAYEPANQPPEMPGEKQPQVSFGSLMKEASDNLAKAQLAGGNQVELGEKQKRSRISLG